MTANDTNHAKEQAVSNDQVKRADVCRPDNWSRNEITLGVCPPGPFTTIAQHESIVAALLQQLAARDSQMERLKEQKEKFMWQVRDTCTRAEAAERVLKEACEILRDAEAFVGWSGCPDGMRERIAAFIAADGG